MNDITQLSTLYSNAIARAEKAEEALRTGVKVKPLEWARSSRSGSYVSHGAGVMYATDQDHDCVILAKWEGSSVLKSAHPTDESAKAFAQEDFEQRILSALILPPPPVRETP